MKRPLNKFKKAAKGRWKNDYLQLNLFPQMGLEPVSYAFRAECYPF